MSTEKKEEKIPFRKKVKSWAKNLLQDESDEKPEEKNEKKQEDRLENLIQRIEKIDKHLHSPFIPDDIQKNMNAHIKEVAVLGFNDGVNHLKTNALPLFIAKAEKLFEQCQGILKSKLKAVQNEISLRKDIADRKKNQSKIHHDYLKYLQHHFKFNERGNTIGEFVLYFILFVIIFLADLPLVIEMIKRLFFTAINEELTFEKARDWEALITAIGISSCTVYIKVWYDEFIGRKYGHSVISVKKFEEMFKGDDKTFELSDEDKENIHKSNKKIKIAKTFILLFTITIILLLGVFRMFAWEQSQALISRIPSEILFVTLTSLTLLFSIIGGVCLSIALNALTNYRRLKNSAIENEKLEEAYLNEIKEEARLKAEEFHLTEITTYWSLEGWRKHIKDLLTSYYEMGFQEGMNEPDFYMKDLTFFEKVIKWRETTIAKKINSSTLKTP